MAAPILPTADSLVTAAIDAIVAARPEALAHFNSGGHWSDLTTMWRAQALVCLGRLADEVRSRRLRFATGEALRSLAASEFQTALAQAPQPAIAQIALVRPLPGGIAPSGIIPAGTQFTKVAQPQGIALPAPNAYPLPIASATYTTISPCYVPASTLAVPSNSALVFARAVTAGANGNVPNFVNYASNVIQPSQPLFDPTFTTIACLASGGSSGVSDPILKAAARAYALGQYGPTDPAIVAGLLQQQSVRHFAIFPANAFLDYAQVYVADESWGSSYPWVAQVAQTFVDTWQGFGCRVRVGAVTNLHITVSPTIVLASTDALNYTEAIDVNVRAAVSAYFNDRTDWYTWRADALRAAISSADPRILYCSRVVVADGVTNAPLQDSNSSVSMTEWNSLITHYYPVDQGVNFTPTTYLPPS
jgi:hypothetical protein